MQSQQHPQSFVGPNHLAMLRRARCLNYEVFTVLLEHQAGICVLEVAEDTQGILHVKKEKMGEDELMELASKGVGELAEMQKAAASA